MHRTPRRSFGSPAVAFLLALALVLAAACGSGHGKHQLSITLTAPECGGGYDLLGAAVVVTDEHGTIIGSGTATGGYKPPVYSPGSHDSSGGPAPVDASHAGCTVTSQVRVPRATFYSVKVGTHSGRPYSYDDLQKQGWKLVLSLS